MNGEESVFSCIKQQDSHEGAASHAPASAPSSQPYRGSSPGQHDDLCAKVAALEAKIQKLEEINSASAAAAAGLKSETQAAQLRSAELEREVTGLKKLVEVFTLERRAGRDAVSAATGHFKEELASYSSRIGSIEGVVRGLDPSSLNAVSLSVGLFEGRLKNIETGLANELKERFSLLDSACCETARKAVMAQETAAGSARRMEKVEEKIARLTYIENRVNAGAEKLERIYELEALSQSLILSVEGMEKHFSSSMRDSATLSAQNKKISSDFDSLSLNVKHLAALFNQFRTELAFLMPKTKETAGG